MAYGGDESVCFIEYGVSGPFIHSAISHRSLELNKKKVQDVLVCVLCNCIQHHGMA